MNKDSIQRVLLRLIICEPATLETGCWEWPGSLMGKGYPNARVNGKPTTIHRFIYEHFLGSIPEGYELHHRCRNKKCCNFEHLELKTDAEHSAEPDSGTSKIAQMNRIKTHCPSGHEYTEENTYWRPDGRGRQCILCMRKASNKYYWRNKNADCT